MSNDNKNNIVNLKKKIKKAVVNRKMLICSCGAEDFMLELSGDDHLYCSCAICGKECVDIKMVCSLTTN